MVRRVGRGLCPAHVCRSSAPWGADLRVGLPEPIRRIGLFDAEATECDRRRGDQSPRGQVRRFKDFDGAARLLKVLSHPVRLKIVCGLLGEPANLTRISRDLDVPISTIAQHLGLLRGSGVLEGRRSGVEVIFHVADQRVPGILNVLCARGHGDRMAPHWRWQELAKRS